MDGFNHEYSGEVCATKGNGGIGTYPYAYVKKSQVQPYWDIANNWVLAANFYPTELGPSFVAHLNLIAGTTEIAENHAVANYPLSVPWGCDNHADPGVAWVSPVSTPGPTAPPRPCYNEFHTIADELDSPPPSELGLPPTPIPWAFYAPSVNQGGGYIWSAFDAIDAIKNGPDWDKYVKPHSPSWQILEDIPHDVLDSVGVVWVVPNSHYSDHAGITTDEGPSWVGDIVNAIGKKTTVWNSSVIIVLWDDWGGWYDSAPPPKLGFDGTGYGSGVLRGEGIRTPMLIISPYAKKALSSGTVSLTYFNPGSILKFIEQVFNLPSLGTLPCDRSYGSGSGSGSECERGYTDATANSIDSVFDWTQSPRPYGPKITTTYSDTFFEHKCGTTSSAPGCKYGYGYGGGSEDAYPPDDE
jgi:hypothetical protein